MRNAAHAARARLPELSLDAVLTTQIAPRRGASSERWIIWPNQPLDCLRRIAIVRPIRRFQLTGTRGKIARTLR